MNSSNDEINTELESFREQWRAEVRSRNPALGSHQTGLSDPSSSRTPQPPPSQGQWSTAKRQQIPDNDNDYIPARVFDVSNDGHSSATDREEPVTALEHYEHAVEKEAQGSLGDSLRLYRKAFRMDSAVDKAYKNKHFPVPPSSTAPQGNLAGTATTAPHTANKPQDAQPQSLKELIASFAGLSIEPAPPPIEGMPQKRCPLADLPEEILIHILRDVAVTDIADFVHVAQVCKRLTYLVATEDQIWRRVCLGSEVGFGGMHYQWQQEVEWDPLEDEQIGEGCLILSSQERIRQQQTDALATTNTLLSTAYSTSWQRMFRLRPRIRFNGCYISTVNYIRSGQASAHQTTWNSPVHIVTYFRYLRFFRDGTAISLLTTSEPGDVVHHLTKELLALHQGGAMTHLPSIVMQSAFKGRWRLSSAADNPEASLSDVEGDVFVETEGVGKYLYRLDLSLRSAGKGAKNNKLVWKSFQSYNKLTQDWGEFHLKNGKPFIFSRVKSYGMGG